MRQISRYCYYSRFLGFSHAISWYKAVRSRAVVVKVQRTCVQGYRSRSPVITELVESHSLSRLCPHKGRQGALDAHLRAPTTLAGKLNLAGWRCVVKTVWIRFKSMTATPGWSLWIILRQKAANLYSSAPFLSILFLRPFSFHNNRLDTTSHRVGW